MRTASILLVLVVMLGGANQSLAANHTFRLGEQKFGFFDLQVREDVNKAVYVGGAVTVGPLGYYRVPFTATQGLVGFCAMLAMLMIIPLLLNARWKRRQPNRP